MTEGPKARVPFRRRREGRTDYRRRLALLKGGLPRIVFRKSLQNTTVQIVTYDSEGDKVVASAVSRELRKFGWTSGTGNVPAAYLTGYLAGKRGKAKGITAAVLDIGLNTPTHGSRAFASLKGILDAGIDVPHDTEILPSPERLEGQHLGENAVRVFKEVKTKLEAA